MTESASTPARALDRLRQTAPARLRAAGVHFAISTVIFAVALYLILVEWYPAFHFGMDGGWQGVRIMAAVDLVLGPTLTLAIFNPLKARKLIVFDLCCIGVAQLAALVWGFYAIHSQHPVAVSYYDGSFYSVPIEPLKIEKYDVSQLAALSGRKPALVYVATPAGQEEEARAAMQEMFGEVALHEDPFFFRRFDRHWAADVRPHALNPAEHAKQAPAFGSALREFLEKNPGEYLYFPYQGRYGGCTLAFTPAGELAGALGCEKY